MNWVETFCPCHCTNVGPDKSPNLVSYELSYGTFECSYYFSLNIHPLEQRDYLLQLGESR